MPSPKVLVPLVLGALAVVWLLSRSKKSAPSHEIPDRSPSAPEILAPSAAPEAKTTPKEAQELVQSKKRLGQEVVLGLKRIRVEQAGRKLAFHVRPRTDGSACQVGDFDQIKSLAHSADERIFYLSLEAVAGSSADVQKFPMSVAEIAGGNRFDVHVDQTNDVAYYGVYLCSYEKKKSGCEDKPSMTAKDWRLTAHGKRVLDKNIHFQMLAVRGNEVFLLPSNKWDKESLRKIQKFVEGEGGGLNAAFTKLRTMLGQLSSLPAIVSGNTLELNLPYRGADCR